MTKKRKPYVTRDPLDIIIDQAHEIEQLHTELISLRVQLEDALAEVRRLVGLVDPVTGASLIATLPADYLGSLED